ncbi:MAG: hypothetical protein N4A47_06195 [Clostridia bacterium]|jgi:hypothetical protein|nr:hypothetical protein [Clostridia bacterium]
MGLYENVFEEIKDKMKLVPEEIIKREIKRVSGFVKRDKDVLKDVVSNIEEQERRDMFLLEDFMIKVDREELYKVSNSLVYPLLESQNIVGENMEIDEQKRKDDVAISLDIKDYTIPNDMAKEDKVLNDVTPKEIRDAVLEILK